MNNAEHDSTVEDAHDEDGIAKEVSHSVSYGARGEAAFADDEDDRDDAE